jgi:hypothetical protein
VGAAEKLVSNAEATCIGCDSQIEEVRATSRRAALFIFLGREATSEKLTRHTSTTMDVNAANKLFRVNGAERAAQFGWVGDTFGEVSTWPSEGEGVGISERNKREKIKAVLLSSKHAVFFCPSALLEKGMLGTHKGVAKEKARGAERARSTKGLKTENAGSRLKSISGDVAHARQPERCQAPLLPRMRERGSIMPRLHLAYACRGPSHSVASAQSCGFLPLFKTQSLVSTHRNSSSNNPSHAPGIHLSAHVHRWLCLLLFALMLAFLVKANCK